ncbi:MAG: hypothetical protein RL385_3263 [Pseudomonadota bacterium]|jgi:hypothetical protein
MMGELVSHMTVVEIVNIVTSTNWRGELHIAGGSGRRTLAVDRGALKHATTDVAAERLGERLHKAGRISPEFLAPISEVPLTDRELGLRILEAKVLTEAVLFDELRRQAEAVFYAGLLETKGTYWFVARGVDAAPPPMALHLPIQALLMEGVQRIDEMALFRERLPHNRLFPFVPPDARKPGNDAATNAVLVLCDGKHNIDAIAVKTALGEFPTLKAVHGLLRSHKAQLLSGPTVDPREVTRLVRFANDVMRDIFLAIGTFGRMEIAQRTVSHWLADSRHVGVLGDRVDVDGTLDRTAVQTLLETLGSDDPMGLLYHALQELCAFALFTATQHLPRPEEQQLARHVHHRLKRL